MQPPSIFSCTAHLARAAMETQLLPSEMREQQRLLGGQQRQQQRQTQQGQTTAEKQAQQPVLATVHAIPVETPQLPPKPAPTTAFEKVIDVFVIGIWSIEPTKVARALDGAVVYLSSIDRREGILELRRLGIHTVVAGVMNRHTDNAKIQIRCCYILILIMRLDIESRATLSLLDCLRSVLSSMAAFPGHPIVQSNACVFLSEYFRDSSEHTEFTSLAGVKLMLLAMGKHPNVEALQQSACVLIAQLSTSNSDLRSEFVESGAIVLVAQTMQSFSHKQELQNYARVALTVLMDENMPDGEDGAFFPNAPQKSEPKPVPSPSTPDLETKDSDSSPYAPPLQDTVDDTKPMSTNSTPRLTETDTQRGTVKSPRVVGPEPPEQQASLQSAPITKRSRPVKRETREPPPSRSRAPSRERTKTPPAPRERTVSPLRVRNHRPSATRESADGDARKRGAQASREDPPTSVTNEHVWGMGSTLAPRLDDGAIVSPGQQETREDIQPTYSPCFEKNFERHKPQETRDTKPTYSPRFDRKVERSAGLGTRDIQTTPFEREAELSAEQETRDSQPMFSPRFERKAVHPDSQEKGNAQPAQSSRFERNTIRPEDQETRDTRTAYSSRSDDTSMPSDQETRVTRPSSSPRFGRNVVRRLHDGTLDMVPTYLSRSQKDVGRRVGQVTRGKKPLRSSVYESKKSVTYEDSQTRGRTSRLSMRVQNRQRRARSVSTPRNREPELWETAGAGGLSFLHLASSKPQEDQAMRPSSTPRLRESDEWNLRPPRVTMDSQDTSQLESRDPQSSRADSSSRMMDSGDWEQATASESSTLVTIPDRYDLWSPQKAPSSPETQQSASPPREIQMPPQSKWEAARRWGPMPEWREPHPRWTASTDRDDSPESRDIQTKRSLSEESAPDDERSFLRRGQRTRMERRQLRLLGGLVEE